MTTPRDIALTVDAAALRTARLSAAMTQRDLARQAGIARITVSRLEQGRPASTYSVRAIAGALGLDLCTLIKVVAK